MPLEHRHLAPWQMGFRELPETSDKNNGARLPLKGLLVKAHARPLLRYASGAVRMTTGDVGQLFIRAELKLSLAMRGAG